ncbi:Putative glycoside hydrolase, family 76, six-hairpin glycosidase superfamily [Septoria linicola]|uniref:Mannan endo-1,6-alpha-mannosidase n=1 Tax=Septoria linicola TaxID=215465 RepID=A0A9Q9EJK3_9PEZI|nr:putative glycoside hydrolase, family 76, six-hairpin glycosidase superfamily [Septoria linicola]USW52277.1 Putative glycoside hydrolase, family 76, six-hairpin glycosidase superfamily [Septoria linicola]
MRSTTILAALSLAAQFSSGLELNLDDQNSIKSAAKVAADGMMKWYTGNSAPGGIPGLLPGPYYWWEAGAMFGSLIDYWYYTGDDSYNADVTQALLFQVGPDDNYMPPNQSKSLGNDDQAFWGIAAMTAAETNFPNPPADKPQWLALAQAVFQTQAVRWDDQTCGGGLKWQIFTFNQGYNYKNAISNGCFFNLAARLGLYTQNATYLDWADRTWDWMTAPGIAMLDDNYYVFDGTDDTMNCTELSHLQWSYNAGVFLYGAAIMWNVTEGDARARWQERTQGLLDAAIKIFFKNQIMIEIACEPSANCNIDQQTFKAYLSRWMAASVKVAPWTHDTIMPLIRASATAAALSCTGGDDGQTCGTDWLNGTWDGGFGVGQQMNALEVIQSNMIDAVGGPLSNTTGGTSKGDYSAGTGYVAPKPLKVITTGDTVGAWILTFVVGSALSLSLLWIAIDGPIGPAMSKGISPVKSLFGRFGS